MRRGGVWLPQSDARIPVGGATSSDRGADEGAVSICEPVAGGVGELMSYCMGDVLDCCRLSDPDAAAGRMGLGVVTPAAAGPTTVAPAIVRDCRVGDLGNTSIGRVGR